MVCLFFIFLSYFLGLFEDFLLGALDFLILLVIPWVLATFLGNLNVPWNNFKK